MVGIIRTISTPDNCITHEKALCFDALINQPAFGFRQTKNKKITNHEALQIVTHKQDFKFLYRLSIHRVNTKSINYLSCKCFSS